MRCSAFFFILICIPFLAISQNKYEREIRIDKADFPVEALDLVSPYLEDVKRVRFYRETDSIKVSYEAKFKKGKLLYSVEFDQTGKLEDIEFVIKKNDIPEESWNNIIGWLNNEFEKTKVKKIQQQYPNEQSSPEELLKEAFQNLILPYIHYELIFSAQNGKGFQMYEGLFDANGKMLKIRKSLKPPYDHILY